MTRFSLKFKVAMTPSLFPFIQFILPESVTRNFGIENLDHTTHENIHSNDSNGHSIDENDSATGAMKPSNVLEVPKEINSNSFTDQEYIIFLELLKALLTTGQRKELVSFVEEHQAHLDEDLICDKQLQFTQKNLHSIIKTYYLYYFSIDPSSDVDFESKEDIWICIMGIITHCERRNEIIQGILGMSSQTQEVVMNLMKAALEKWPELHESDSHNDEENSEANWEDALDHSEEVLDVEGIDSDIPIKIINGAVVGSNESTGSIGDNFSNNISTSSIGTFSNSIHAEPIHLHAQGLNHISTVEQFMDAISPKPKLPLDQQSTKSPRAISPLRQMSMYRNRMLLYNEKMKEKVAETEKSIEKTKYEKKIMELKEEVEQLRQERDLFQEKFEWLNSRATEDFENMVQTPKEFRNSMQSFSNFSNMQPSDDVELKDEEIYTLKDEIRKLQEGIEAKDVYIHNLQKKILEYQTQIDEQRVNIGILKMREVDEKSVVNELEGYKKRIEELLLFRNQINDIKSENERLIGENRELYENLQRTKKKLIQIEDGHKMEIGGLTHENKKLQLFNESLTESLNDMQIELNSKSEQIIYLQGEISQLKETLHDTQEAVIQMSTQTQRVEMDKVSESAIEEPFTTELKQKMNRLEDDYIRLMHEVEMKKRVINEQTETIDSLKLQLTESTLQKEKLQSAQASVETIASHTSARTESELGEKILHLSQELYNVQLELKSATQEMETQSSKIDSKDKQIFSLREENNSLKSKYEQTRDECNNLKDLMLTRDAENQSLRISCEELQSDKSSIQDVLDKTLKEIKLVQNRFQSLEKAHESVLQTNSKLKQRYKSYKLQLKRAQIDNIHLWDNIDINTTSTVKLLRDEILFLRNENEIYRKNIGGRAQHPFNSNDPLEPTKFENVQPMASQKVLQASRQYENTFNHISDAPKLQTYQVSQPAKNPRHKKEPSTFRKGMTFVGYRVVKSRYPRPL